MRVLVGKGDQLSFRCMVFPRGNGYIAECIDLNLASFRLTPEQARAHLEESVCSYLELAWEGDPSGLIPRPSPALHKLRYRLLQLKSVFQNVSWNFLTSPRS